jgi:ABC-2 type transport system ATP-binding protein
VLIAKALSHEPRVLFLDEPTAGVDVELRKDMWDLIRGLKQQGVTIILTTHYIEEAEAIAERIGVITGGQLLLAESKSTLMKRLGKKYLHIELQSTLDALPAELERYKLERGDDGRSLRYVYDTHDDRTGITALLSDLNTIGIRIRDVQTYQSSLEEIFVDLVKEKT